MNSPTSIANSTARRLALALFTASTLALAGGSLAGCSIDLGGDHKHVHRGHGHGHKNHGHRHAHGHRGHHGGHGHHGHGHRGHR